MFNPRTIADEAEVIIDGFAFIKKEEGRITVVNQILKERYREIALQYSWNKGYYDYRRIQGFAHIPTYSAAG